MLAFLLPFLIVAIIIGVILIHVIDRLAPLLIPTVQGMAVVAILLILLAVLG